MFGDGQGKQRMALPISEPPDGSSRPMKAYLTVLLQNDELEILSNLMSEVANTNFLPMTPLDSEHAALRSCSVKPSKDGQDHLVR